MTNLFKKTYTWIKQKTKVILFYIFGGGVALALTLSPGDMPKSILPININGVETTFTFTDENLNETLLIYSSAEDYYGFGSVKVPFAIRNVSGKAQNIKITVSVPSGQEAVRIKRYIDNTTTVYPEVIIPEVMDRFGSTTLEKITPERIVTKTNWEEQPLKSYAVTTHFRKSIGTRQTNKESGTYAIKNNEVLYFEASVKFTKGGEFYIEAFGDKGAYGHLDPGAFPASDNFDSYGDGDLNGENGGSGWGAAWSGSTNYDVQGTVSFKGTKAVVNSVNNGGKITRALTSSVDSGDVYYTVFSSDVTGDGMQFEIRDGATLGGAISFENDGGSTYQIRISTAGEPDVMQGLVADTWYIINVNFVSSTQMRVRAKVEGGSFNAFSNTLTYISSVSDPDTISYTAFDLGGGSPNLYFDEIGTTDPDVEEEVAVGFEWGQVI